MELETNELIKNDASLTEEEKELLTSPSQVGNKIWRMIPGNGVKITKTTNSSVDYYEFDSRLSEEKGNVLEIRDNGIYAPELSAKTEEMKNEIESLKEDIDKIKSTEFRTTRSIRLNEFEDPSTGNRTITAEAKISTQEGNNLEIKNDGLYAKSAAYGPGSIEDIERRLSILELELYHLNQIADNLRTTAKISKDGSVTPDPTVP